MPVQKIISEFKKSPLLVVMATAMGAQSTSSTSTINSHKLALANRDSINMVLERRIQTLEKIIHDKDSLYIVELKERAK